MKIKILSYIASLYSGTRMADFSRLLLLQHICKYHGASGQMPGASLRTIIRTDHIVEPREPHVIMKVRDQ